MDDLNTIVDLIQLRMTKMRMSPEGLAEVIGEPKSAKAIRRLLERKTDPRWSTIAKAMRATGVEIKTVVVGNN